MFDVVCFLIKDGIKCWDGGWCEFLRFFKIFGLVFKF